MKQRCGVKFRVKLEKASSKTYEMLKRLSAKLERARRNFRYFDSENLICFYMEIAHTRKHACVYMYMYTKYLDKMELFYKLCHAFFQKLFHVRDINLCTFII